MKRLRLASMLTIGVLSFLAVGLAQPSPYVLQTFDLSQLDARPGQIVVSPDVLTLLEFDDQVADVSTARPDAMTIEVTGNVIRLRANWRAGSTDLVVTVANQTAMFTVTIDPEGEHTRRYLVEKPKPPIPVASSTMRLHRAGAPNALQELGRQAALPDWLSVSFHVLAVPGEEIVIQYGIKNAGTHDIANDPLRLKLLQAEHTVPFTLERLSTGGTINRIKPGYAEYGTILVEDPLPEGLTLVWELVEIGPGYTHTLREEFHEGLLQPVH